MLAPDRPFVIPNKKPLMLPIAKGLALKCLYVPPGKAMLGAPFFMTSRYQEEYPHLVTLTRGFYLGEIPITQEMWLALAGGNPSKLKGANLPVENPLFPDMDKFCEILSQRTGKRVRLPSTAEWEYAARSGTSNPGFAEKYADQFSNGGGGWKAVLPVKSRKPNAWGFYDLFSCWWEITGDTAMYPQRAPAVDPRYPARSDHSNRAGMGVVKENWSIAMREFEDEKGLGYTSNKFRILVEE
jgi:formylglycine-generating enzyme required for sulfatase activity